MDDKHLDRETLYILGAISQFKKDALKRLDALENHTLSLNVKAARLEESVKAMKSDAKKVGGVIGGGVATIIVALVEGLKHALRGW